VVPEPLPPGAFAEEPGPPVAGPSLDVPPAALPFAGGVARRVRTMGCGWYELSTSS
jgi:hypothetical protein